jgi:hypothetical protein
MAVTMDSIQSALGIGHNLALSADRSRRPAIPSAHMNRSISGQVKLAERAAETAAGNGIRIKEAEPDLGSVAVGHLGSDCTSGRWDVKSDTCGFLSR